MLLVSVKCSTQSALAGLLSGAFWPTEHVESAAGPVGETDHSDWRSNTQEEQTRVKRLRTQGSYIVYLYYM